MQQFVLMAGNLSDGYKPIGPFSDFDRAADYATSLGIDGWIMEMLTPAEYERQVLAAQT